MANNNSEISSKDKKRRDAEIDIPALIDALTGKPSTTGVYKPLQNSPTLGNLVLTAYKKYCDLTEAIGIKLRPFKEKSAKAAKEANEYIAIKTENTLGGMKNIIDGVIDNVEAKKKSQGKGKD